MSQRDPTPPQSEERRATMGRWRQWDARSLWWWVLDVLETRRSLRWWLSGVAVAVVGLVSVRIWVYPGWARRNAIHMAQDWIAAGHYDYAADAIGKALQTFPDDPQLWHAAAQLARQTGQKAGEVECARRASSADPGNVNLALEWASAALRNEELDTAERVLADLPPGEAARSAFAQRLYGEVARRRLRLSEAEIHFAEANRLGGPNGENEIPLGLVLLSATETDRRERGLQLLGRWAADREWGPAALRILIDDALTHDDRPAMVKWAERLRAHPAITVGDMPRCLAAIARGDPGRFPLELAQLERDHSITPVAAAQLAGWLNQIGRSAELLQWMAGMPAAQLSVPPLVVARAEALRQIGDWNELRAVVQKTNWGADAEFVRWCYGLRTAEALGDQVLLEQFRRTLDGHAQVQQAHAVFAAATLYTWGMKSAAEALWWRAAERDNPMKVEALGSLARLYQVDRDADGLYKVFNLLHALRPSDSAIANNFAFYAALTGNREKAAADAARANVEKYPRNPVYACTLAFVQLQGGRVDKALAIVQPLFDAGNRSAPVLFVCGLAWAQQNQREKAAEWLHKLDPQQLTVRELQLVNAALSGGR